jgi:hypothetical protein
MTFCPDRVVYGDLATWIVGVATAVTLIFLVYQWFKQQQSGKRAQAERVVAWNGRREHLFPIRNGSDQPIFKVIAYVVWTSPPVAEIAAKWGKFGDGEGAEKHYATTGESINRVRAVYPVVPPGSTWGMPMAGPGGTQSEPYKLGLEVAFTDAAGQHWVRTALGELVKRRHDAFQQYKFAVKENVSYYAPLLAWTDPE